MRILFLAMITSISSSAFAGWGAIAYSPATDQVGFSSGHWTYEQASHVALYNCGAWDCSIVNWQQNSCAAFATGPYGSWGLGNGWDASSAIYQAVAQCGPFCTWRAWSCN